MNEDMLSQIVQYSLGGSIAIVFYFLKGLHTEMKEHEKRIRRNELLTEKQGAENTAIFDRLGELRECVQALNGKFDRLLEKK